MSAAGKGKSMASLLNLQPGENVRTILPVRNLEEDGKFIFFATRKGTVKKDSAQGLLQCDGTRHHRHRHRRR